MDHTERQFILAKIQTLELAQHRTVREYLATKDEKIKKIDDEILELRKLLIDDK